MLVFSYEFQCHSYIIFISFEFFLQNKIINPNTIISSSTTNHNLKKKTQIYKSVPKCGISDSQVHVHCKELSHRSAVILTVRSYNLSPLDLTPLIIFYCSRLYYTSEARNDFYHYKVIRRKISNYAPRRRSIFARAKAALRRPRGHNLCYM